MSGGWNPVTGRDSSGSRPNFAPYGAPLPGPGQAYVPHYGGPGAQQQYLPVSNVTYGTTIIGPPGSFTYPGTYTTLPGQASIGFAPQVAMAPATTGMPGMAGPHTVSYQPNGAGNMLPRQPQPTWPSIDPSMPAAQMTNSTGGLGCEPGYNYFFPADHTKVHVFRSEVAPWRLPPQTQISFSASHVPCSTTFADLLRGFGCNNPVPKKNQCYELVSGGGGKWYRGMSVCGADKDMMKMPIREVGWDSSRNGLENGKPVVCLWFCKN